MRTLLRLQDLDLQIEACKARELEIPMQKGKFEVQRRRLADELKHREEVCQRLQIEQRECESEVSQKQALIEKYDQQLFAIKKNEEYQALLHEIDALKKQIATHEERELALLVELDDVKARLDEDRQRIDVELKEIDRQCAEIDAELSEAVKHRKMMEEQRKPLAAQVDGDLLGRYKRIRQSKKTGPAVVALRGEICTGCNMSVLAQIVNEVLAGKVHACPTCGRLLYEKSNFEDADGANGGAFVQGGASR
ncbi:MAG: hypothetical protein JXR94_23355 [Candidatus Hydrogenedentes bacterium]|nr:hypothetical protein [Candidatus Hydrogenedentota bacterium]